MIRGWPKRWLDDAASRRADNGGVGVARRSRSMFTVHARYQRCVTLVFQVVLYSSSYRSDGTRDHVSSNEEMFRNMTALVPQL